MTKARVIVEQTVMIWVSNELGWSRVIVDAKHTMIITANMSGMGGRASEMAISVEDPIVVPARASTRGLRSVAFLQIVCRLHPPEINPTTENKALGLIWTRGCPCLICLISMDQRRGNLSSRRPETGMSMGVGEIRRTGNRDRTLIAAGG